MASRVRQLAQLMRACADETRLRLLNLLSGETEVCVLHLVEVIGVSQPKVSRHLAYLRRSGLVADRKDGLWVYYRLARTREPEVAYLLDTLKENLSELAELHGERAQLQRIMEARPVVGLTSRTVAAKTIAPTHLSETDLDVVLL